MSKKILLCCILLSFIYCNKENTTSPLDENQQNKWITKTNMPTARGYCCGAQIDSEFYVMGGMIDLSHNSDAVEVYNLKTDTWTVKNQMPEKILGLAAVALDGKIYTFGGRTGHIFSGTTLNYTYMYDPVYDSWTRKTDMSTARALTTASVIGGKIYIIGGAITGYEGTALVLMYDPVSDTWTTKKSLPRGRAGHTANLFDGKVFVIGGGTASQDDAGTAYPDFDVYDPVNNSWDSKADMARGRIGHGSGIINNKLYICGGFSGNNPLKDLMEYDFNDDTWTSRTSMPSDRRCFASCVYDGRLFIFGGITGSSGGPAITSVAMYIPSVSN
jgi:N-acetylneuraminic acid mutarotase